MKNYKFGANKPRDLVFAIGICVVGFIFVTIGNNLNNFVSQAQMGCGLQSMFGYNSSQCFWVKLLGFLPFAPLMMLIGIVGIIIGIPAALVIVKDLYHNSTVINNLDQAIVEDPQNPTGYVKRAHVMRAKGEKELALADYNKAIELDPNNLEARYYRGAILLGKSDFHAALADYNNILEHHPHHTTAFNARGIVHEQMHQFKRALDDFEKASALDPSSVQFKNNISRVKAKIDIDKSK